MSTEKTISICIPSFNRPAELQDALESVAAQGAGDWDVVVAENFAPRRDEVADVVRTFSQDHQNVRVTLLLNRENIGYDANVRRLVDVATGRYCLFLADDDLLTPGALRKMLVTVSTHNPGVVLRCWQSVDGLTRQKLETHAYFPTDRHFEPSQDTAAAFFRRSVFLSGLMVERVPAQQMASARHDGSLLYQLYLVGRILLTQSGYYVSAVTTLRRVGGEHYFGSSNRERSTYAPGSTTMQHSLSFFTGMVDIAQGIDHEMSPGFRRKVLTDLSWYSYPALAMHAEGSRQVVFFNYARSLARIGLGKRPVFWLYYFALALLGRRACEFLMALARRMLRHTPVLCGTSGVADAGGR